ncbi:MAG TPA: PAS domain-containing protein [Burkholderiaceae bacterium]|nr:PAS domain-containing protein [Burkholderiaceae bacterium]
MARPLFSSEALTLAEESAGIGVWDIDLTTGTARGTAQFFRIMGLEPTADPVPMERIRSLRHPDDRERVLEGFRAALDSGRDAYEMEYRILRPDGELRWIFGRGRVVRDADGRPVRYSGVDIDITQRKHVEAALAEAKQALERMNQALEERVRERTAQLETEARLRAQAEARLHQAQKMEALGQLTGGIAHDFNNILQVVMGNVEVVRRLLPRYDGAAVLQPHVETVLQATRKAAQLTQRLLAFSRQQALEPAVIDVNRLIADMAEMIRRTLGETIKVETALAADLWPTFTDRNQLESALLNLVVNARDAMADGGHLVIETQNLDLRDADDLPPGQYVVVAVSDTGSGIPQELLAKVFDPFFTTKETGKGSGLGLSMVYGFAKQSCGQARIYSEVGAGTTVKMFLPRSAAQPDHEPAARSIAEPYPQARAGETILVVEDNDAVRRHGVAALESFGYRVIEAPDAASALQLLDGKDAPRIDLLFTDVVLPGGMTGRALADAVRERRGAGFPVLFTSGYTRDTIVHNGRLDSDVRLLNKPYSLEHLARSVRLALDARVEC